mmetsp:Transcript_31872/g.28222  ORF Transcript_31872/g.28222 Transcript_31872/m.28222 type:complete len:87 (-) Transcript_31872:710-970(-)
MIVTIITSAAIGPMVLTLPTKSPYVAMSWRIQSATILMSLYLIFYYFSMGKLGFTEFKNDFKPKNLAKAAVLAITLFIWLIGLVMG